MNSVPKVDKEDLIAEAFQDAVQTFEATREKCQRIDKWAMKELADPCTSLSIHDLAQYCEVTIQQCYSYLIDKRPLLQSEFVREQAWRGLGALGFEPNESSNEHDMLLLDHLLAECRRRTLEVVNLLDKKLARNSWEKSNRRHKRAEVEAQQPYDYQRFFIAVKAVHDNHTAGGDSPYVLEKRRRTAKEVEEHLLPQILAFGNNLSEFGHLKEPSTDNPFPENSWVQETIQNFL